MGATWTVLGAGTILPRRDLGCAGYALRPSEGAPVTLFDCGPGTIRSLAAAGIALREVERVVISHFHLDHCLDLFALAFARNNPSLQPPPALEIVGPEGLAALLDRGEGTLGRWAKNPHAKLCEVRLRGGRATLERELVRLSWAATGHTPEALAWRAELEDGASVAYTGDTGENPAVADLARGADLFVVECSLPDGEAVEGHLTPSAAGRLARASNCRRTVLTHFYPPVDPADARRTAAAITGGPVDAARDGSVFPVASG